MCDISWLMSKVSVDASLVINEEQAAVVGTSWLGYSIISN